MVVIEGDGTAEREEEQIPQHLHQRSLGAT